MTCADRLRDLRAQYAAWSEDEDAARKARDAAVDALPEIAAVIAAAETYIGALNDYGMADDGPLADSLAALAARLEGGEA